MDGNDVVVYIRGINLIYADDGDKTYYHFNAHGDVVVLTNSNGSKTKSYSYNAFGVEYNEATLDDNPFRYCGEYYDKETKTIYLRARYYNAEQGRFTQEDTHWNVSNMIYGDNPDNTIPNFSAIIQSGNLYVYCGNNPIIRYDPYGYAWYHTAWNNLKENLYKFSHSIEKPFLEITSIILSNVTLEAGISIGMDIAVNAEGIGVDAGVRMDIIGVALEDGELKFGHFGKSGASVSAGDYTAGYESRTYESFDGEGDYKTGMQQIQPYDKGVSYGQSMVFVIGYHYKVGFSFLGATRDLINYFD